MQIYELIRLAKWFNTNIVNARIPNNYKNLYNKLNQNAQQSNNKPSQPFEQEKEELFTALRSVNLNSLTLEQIAFLKQLDIIDKISEEGVSEIEAILFVNNLDIATAAQKIGEFSSKVAQAHSILTEIHSTLNKSFSLEDDREILEDSVMMRVYFQEDSSISDVTDFKKLSANWYDIARGISMAQNRSPEDFKIIGAQKGSLIIEMAVLAGIATSVSTILLAGLKVAEKVINILKEIENLKKLKLENRTIEKELKKEAESVKKNGIQSILETTIEKLKLDIDSDGDKITALKKAITKLIDFTQKGGAVDFIEPEINEEGEQIDNPVRKELADLKTDVQEIRKLENKIKLLENKISN